MRVVCCKHRVDTGQLCKRDNTAGGVAIQTSRRGALRAKRLRRVVESIPAPGGAGIVAADEREALAALRHEMPRYRDARFVIVEPRDSVDRCRRKIPCLHDGNARAPQQPLHRLP